MLGIDASATPGKTRDQVARIARHTAKLIELGRDLRDDEISLLEGMIIDPVYEGKSMAGLIDLVRSGGIPKDSTVLCEDVEHPARLTGRRRYEPELRGGIPLSGGGSVGRILPGGLPTPPRPPWAERWCLIFTVAFTRDHFCPPESCYVT